LQNFANDDDDDEEDADLENYDAAVAAQIRKARKLLKDAKKKMDPPPSITEQQQTDDDKSSSSLPFFAQQQQQSFTSKAITNAQKIKSKTPSGSIIADGAAMTSLSNSEPWELRSLSQIGFESEARSDYDGNIVEVDTNSSSTSSLADKDVAMSIYNLRKTLQNEDFKSVFNSRNRFIGEVD
jgi:hypothetical protein